jgi:hypothetical protein
LKQEKNHSGVRVQVYTFDVDVLTKLFIGIYKECLVLCVRKDNDRRTFYAFEFSYEDVFCVHQEALTYLEKDCQRKALTWNNELDWKGTRLNKNDWKISSLFKTKEQLLQELDSVIKYDFSRFKESSVIAYKELKKYVSEHV